MARSKLQNEIPEALVDQGFRDKWSNLRQIRTESRFDFLQSDGFSAIMEVISEGQLIIENVNGIDENVDDGTVVDDNVIDEAAAVEIVAGDTKVITDEVEIVNAFKQLNFN